MEKKATTREKPNVSKKQRSIQCKMLTLVRGLMLRLITCLKNLEKMRITTANALFDFDNVSIEPK